LKQDKIRIVLTPLTQDAYSRPFEKWRWCKVAALGRRCNKCVRNDENVVPVLFYGPTVEKDEFGEVVRSGIYTYGETVHIFVERKKIIQAFLPATGMEIRLQSRNNWIKSISITW
jgi:4-hydroxyphenylpyruvate dioxygenase